MLRLKVKKCQSKQTAKTGKEHLGRNDPSRASNLKRHLQRCHLEIFKIVEEKDKETPTRKQMSEKRT